MSIPVLKPKIAPLNRTDSMIAGAISLSLLAFLSPLARQGVDAHHDGIMLKPALDVLAGQTLFRDTFSQYGALTTYLQVMILWINPTLLSIRFLTVIAYAITLFFLYAAWRLVLPRPLAIVSCLLFILCIPAYEKDVAMRQFWLLLPWSSVFAMMFQSAGLYAMMRLIQGGEPSRWGVILGVAGAGVFWCRQPVGVIMIGCLILIWWALHWTNWEHSGAGKRQIAFSILGGYCAVTVLMLGDIFISGAASAWWAQNFIWPSRWHASINWYYISKIFIHPLAGAQLLLILLAVALPAWIGKTLPVFSTPRITIYYLCLGGLLTWQHAWAFQVAQDKSGWVALFPFVVFLQALNSIIQIFTRRGVVKSLEYYLVASLTALSLGSLLQYYPLPDPWHCLWSLAPAFGLVVYVLWRCLHWPPHVLALVLTAVLLPSFYSKILSARDCLNRPMVQLTAPAFLRGMKVPPEEAKNYGQITAALAPILRLQPDLPAVLIGNDALFLCFVNNLANPTPYYVTWMGLADNTDNLRRWGFIQRVRPLMFLHKADWVAVGDFYRRARYVPLLYIDEKALELAVPQEVADALGVTAYGAPLARASSP